MKKLGITLIIENKHVMNLSMRGGPPWHCMW